MIEIRRAADDGAVDEKELAFQSARERTTDRGLPRSGWTGEQHAALRLEIELLRDLRVLERENDVGLERLEHVVESLEIFQLDRLHLAEVDVARHVVLAH